MFIFLDEPSLLQSSLDGKFDLIQLKRFADVVYEGLKQNATIVVVPSTAVESMQLGNVSGIIALTKQLQQEAANKQTGIEGEQRKVA